MPLIDTGLLARYYVDEAASGTTPTHVLDSSGVGADLDLTITYGTGSYTETSGNRGLESIAVNSTTKAHGAINDTSDKIRDALHGATQMTIEIVADLQGFGTNVSRIFGIFIVGGADIFSIEGQTSVNALRLYFNDSFATLASQTGGGRKVYHYVVDTTQGTAADRRRFYVNGVQQTLAGTTIGTQNTTLSIGSGAVLGMLGTGTGSRQLDGIVYYAAVYSGAFSSSDVTNNYDILTLDDDTPTGGSTYPVYSSFFF